MGRSFVVPIGRFQYFFAGQAHSVIVLDILSRISKSSFQNIIEVSIRNLIQKKNDPGNV